VRKFRTEGAESVPPAPWVNISAGTGEGVVLGFRGVYVMQCIDLAISVEDMVRVVVFEGGDSGEDFGESCEPGLVLVLVLVFPWTLADFASALLFLAFASALLLRAFRFPVFSILSSPAGAEPSCFASDARVEERVTRLLGTGSGSGSSASDTLARFGGMTAITNSLRSII
jgi:hypothetical protein